MHMDPPQILLIKVRMIQNWIKMMYKKMLRDPTPEKLDLYEIKMPLFDNGKTKEFLLFVRKFQMSL